MRNKGCSEWFCDGTHLAYKRHRTRDISPCAISKRAWAKYYRDLRRRNVKGKK